MFISLNFYQHLFLQQQLFWVAKTTNFNFFLLLSNLKMCLHIPILYLFISSIFIMKYCFLLVENFQYLPYPNMWFSILMFWKIEIKILTVTFMKLLYKFNYTTFMFTKLFQRGQWNGSKSKGTCHQVCNWILHAVLWPIHAHHTTPSKKM